MKNICVTVAIKNEKILLPFFLDYYLNYINADTIEIYDSNSNDKSLEIICIWQKIYQDRIKYINRDLNEYDERDLTWVKNESWKKHRNDYRWQICVDIDEFLYYHDFTGLLYECYNKGINVIISQGYQMICDTIPMFKNGYYLPKISRIGKPYSNYDKHCIFKSSEVDINYYHGAHSNNAISNTGILMYCNIKVNLQHYHHFGYNNFILRRKYKSTLLSKYNIDNSCSTHWLDTTMDINEFKNIIYESNIIHNDRPCMTYKNIHGAFDFEDIYENAIKNANEDDIFVELGTWYGASTIFMAESIKLSNKKIKFFTVDHFGGDQCMGEFDVTVYDTFMNNKKLYNDYINVLKMPNLEALEFFDNESCSFIFIDCDHMYENVKIELNEWYKKVKPRGVLAGHDYTNRIGVKEAVDEFVIENDLHLNTSISSWYISKP